MIIEYKFGQCDIRKPECLNELTLTDLQDIKSIRCDEGYEVTLFELLTSKYADKTFCKQIDYDYMFGNVSWEEYYLFYADAEKTIFDDWSSREGQPCYTVDPSYITICRFSDLKKLNENDRKDKLKKITCLLQLKNN